VVLLQPRTHEEICDRCPTKDCDNCPLKKLILLEEKATNCKTNIVEPLVRDLRNCNKVIVELIGQSREVYSNAYGFYVS
jgi:hypothetical protein